MVQLPEREKKFEALRQNTGVW